ncbi:MAG: OadG family protein [Bacteroidales bacterium]|nr:OadG family protein [Bacteroidales bacterium]
MSENFSEALMLMGVGLATVFVVLLLVIGFGNLLIKVVNKIAPEEEKKAAPVAAAKSASAAIDPQVQQAIAKAIEQMTAGKGRVEKIERL